MVNAIAAGACDVFNLGAGSTHDFLGRAYLAGESGIPVWHGSAHELGVLDAAMLHACTPARRRPTAPTPATFSATSGSTIC